MLKDRENILNALREKPQKAYQLMRRANLPNEEACQSLLLKMRDEGLVKFDIHKGHGSSDDPTRGGVISPPFLFAAFRSEAIAEALDVLPVGLGNWSRLR